VFFDTLEYREQHPEREQTSSAREEGRSGTGPTRDEGWGKPQGGGTPGERDRESRAGKPVDHGRNGLGEKTPEARSWRAEACHAGERRKPEQSGFADDAGNANRKRGSGVGRRRRPSSANALKGEPRERARLKHTGEIGEGARRRSGQEPQGRNVTRDLECPGVVALVGMMALWGTKPRESGAGDAVERRCRTPESPGQTLERG
jgi:hypothetical protein